MPRPLRIDFVSDISCPWCIIGLRGLEIALERMGDAVEADIHFQPFELNPAMAPEGENIVEHIGRKYGATPEQSAANRANIRERAASVGFTMTMGDDARIYNSFDAHRLLHWAEMEGRQAALKLIDRIDHPGTAPSDSTLIPVTLIEGESLGAVTMR